MNIRLKQALRLLRQALRDFAYGIDAGNAIRHGMKPAPRPAERPPVGPVPGAG